MRAGDVLILVQRRSALFAEIIRACKAADLPIAGADRLKLGAELAVRDLAALLSFLATPEDDLSLAAALRSPLFGWTEAQLYNLAQGRSGYLWSALRDREADHPDTLSILRDLRDQADFLRPYDLIERVLYRHDGRRKLLARLGPEAGDAVEAFLAQALAAARGRDGAAGRALTGPHRGDLAILHVEKDRPAAECSTGEQKALILNLVLAQAARLSRAESAPNPIVLLDEVAAHLDLKRRAALADEITALKLQAFLTGTDESLFDHLKGRALGVRVSELGLTALEDV